MTRIDKLECKAALIFICALVMFGLTIYPWHTATIFLVLMVLDLIGIVCGAKFFNSLTKG